MKDKKRIKRLSAAVISLLTVLSLVIGMAPFDLGLTAYAAASPTLSIAKGTPYFYSISGKAPGIITYGTATATASKMTVSQSGNTISVNETENNKLSEMGYVPIITSVTVPAETTYRTTLTFQLEGNRGGSGSATESIELFDFGSSDKSSSLQFNIEEGSSGYKVRDSSSKKGVSTISTSYSVSVEFQNTSSSEKTIYRYFGFFAGIHWGSSQNHKFTTSCTVSYSRIVDTDAVTPYIHVSSDDARTIVSRSDHIKIGNTFSKNNFVPDKEFVALTSEQQTTVIKTDPYMGNYYTGGVAYMWDYERLSLSTQGNNTLIFSIKKAQSSNGIGKLAYVPFTVPLSVPAHTTRKFYLTFQITYERNTGSGAGFFAELIEGDVPDSFHTAASADMTGNTKLRVYSSSGDAHSGTIEIPVTLKNDTNSTKTYNQSYVFFAGFRNVGLYNPASVYSLELQDIVYTTYEEEYDVIVNAANCTYTAPSKTTGYTQVDATLKANAHYSLPDSVTVQIGGQSLAASKYTYSKSTGKVTIQKDYVKGAVTITASGVPDKYSITYSGLSGASLTTKPTTHTYGTATSVGNPTKTGYVFGGWKINGNAAVSKNLTLGATAYTANITLEATWTAENYNATLSGSNVTASSGFGTGKVSYGTAWTGTIKANSGYVLPDSISVTVGGSVLASTKYTYTKSTGTVKIGASYVTGNIVVTVNGHKHSYTSAVTTAATCTTNGVRTYTCSCGDSYTESISATGHKWASSWTKDSKQHWHVCTNGGCTATDTRTNHSFTWIVDREPTVKVKGLRHEECTVCAYAKPQEEYMVDIVSVEITWGAMEFTYSDGIWNAETHAYEGGGWKPDKTDGNQIIAENTGNVEVSMSFRYTQTNKAVNGSFAGSDKVPITAPIALPAGEKKYAWLILNGKPTTSLNKAALGTVTVTIGGE